MRFERSVEIAATPDRIWSAWVNVEGWPDWTESVDAAERLDDGAFRIGSRARLKQPKMRAAVWEVTELEPNRSFVWRTRSGGMLMVAGHTMESGADHQKVQLTFEITGGLSGLFGRLAAGRIRRYIGMEANGLKAHCEA